MRDELFWSTQIFQNKSQNVLLGGKIKKWIGMLRLCRGTIRKVEHSPILITYSFFSKCLHIILWTRKLMHCRGLTFLNAYQNWPGKSGMLLYKLWARYGLVFQACWILCSTILIHVHRLWKLGHQWDSIFLLW